MDKLLVANIHKTLGGTAVLKGVSFELQRGEVVALLGPSGSGKTTLLRLLAGLDHPDIGRIVLGDKLFFDSQNGTEVPAEKRNLGLVFQSYALWPHRSVFDNIAYGLRLRRIQSGEIRERVLAVLQQIGLEGLAERHPHQLSGGQQQRVALARAIVYKPPLLLLDEPLSNLDAKLREEARVWLREIIEKLGISAVCVTHDQVEALAIADRVLLLEKGRIEQEGSPEEIYENPRTIFAAEFMGSNNRLTGKVAEVRGAMAKVANADWGLWGQLRSDRRAGDAATAVVRIEKTRLRDAPAESSLPAKVITALYLGERWDYLMEVGGQRVRVWAPAAPAQKPYWVEFPPESLWIF
ncbi:MAG TPA: ABC transporter ATP-binding protein [Myxococcaceae bacterium]|nr:ABC transporter ATP-binding protein [Myxococcaceae bacterium]